MADLVYGIHHVWTCSLGQVVEFSHNRPLVEVEGDHSFILEGMEPQGNLGWNWLGLGVIDPNVVDDGINQGMLGGLIGSITKPLDTDSHIICWVALIFNVESQILNLLDG